MTVDLTNDTVIVTGAGRGLGRSYALDLASRGANVIVNDVAADEADAVVAQIVAAGGQAAAVAASVSTPAGGASIVEAALDTFGSVDAVVNNAGFLRCGYFEELSQDDIDSVIDVHLRGAFHVTQPAWRQMVAAGYGRIVFTCSASGMFSNQGLANYAAAKAGLYGLTKALAFEGAAHGIGVNALLPNAATSIMATSPIPNFLELWDSMMPPGITRASIPEERRQTHLVTPLVTFLASRQCAVSGEAYSSIGGHYARMFVGVSDGWLSPTPAVTADDIEAHLAQIRDVTKHSVPNWLFDEWAGVAQQIQDSQRQGSSN